MNVNRIGRQGNSQLTKSGAGVWRFSGISEYGGDAYAWSDEGTNGAYDTAGNRMFQQGSGDPFQEWSTNNVQALIKKAKATVTAANGDWSFDFSVRVYKAGSFRDHKVSTTVLEGQTETLILPNQFLSDLIPDGYFPSDGFESLTFNTGGGIGAGSRNAGGISLDVELAYIPTVLT